MRGITFGASAVVALATSLGCSDSAGSGSNNLGDAGAADGAAFEAGIELRVTVPATGRVFAKLDPAAVATPADPKASADWDVAFEGFDVFTNGGVSGGGQASGFGPLDAATFLGDTVPLVPFTSVDKTGGAFLDWYQYEGSSHALWSRYHVFGVKDGTRLWKVQVLGYYGQRDGGAVAGLYTIRYAELTGSGAGPTQEIANLDATAGGAQAPPSSPSECIDFATGARTMLTPDAARTSSAWHLCFRRQTISVNGELGGPRGVGAVDLEAAKVATETVDPIKALTADSERGRFDAIATASFDASTFRGDRIVSAFGEAWLDRKASPIKPAYAAWLVTAADGTKKYLVGFSSFENPTSQSPGTVVMRIKPVTG